MYTNRCSSRSTKFPAPPSDRDSRRSIAIFCNCRDNIVSSCLCLCAVAATTISPARSDRPYNLTVPTMYALFSDLKCKQTKLASFVDVVTLRFARLLKSSRTLLAHRIFCCVFWIWNWNDEAMKRWSDEAMRRWSDETMKRWNDETMKRWNEIGIDIGDASASAVHRWINVFFLLATRYNNK